ncbi:MAG: 50S ribosomal protein L13 [Crocinitomicaceae bacterium]|nr:50S ribosomal protein L13 [Crocinitomicaceae bacterium]
MDTLSYKTVSANKNTVNKKWLVIDAENQILGRFASRAAFLLRGKHKADYTPHVDCGDNVIVINADKVILSGDKMNSKEYIRHTGYPGGQRITSVREMLEKHPERVVEKAIKGMLPKNKLGADLYRNLKVVTGTEHKHEAQKPEAFDINTIK